MMYIVTINFLSHTLFVILSVAKNDKILIYFVTLLNVTIHSPKGKYTDVAQLALFIQKENTKLTKSSTM
jgi:hypothetical protein